MGCVRAIQDRAGRRSAARAVAVAAGGLAVLTLPLSGVGAASAALAGAAKVTAMVLVLDASGSMKESDGHGSTKIEDARAAVKTIVSQLPTDLQVGLVTYGHRVASTPDHAKACKDVQLVAPVAPLDKAALTAAVGAVAAKGETPIGLSLQQAAAALPAGSNGSVVLVSDGLDSCAPPEPCGVAKQLKASGVQLTVDTVGLRVDAKARTQLTCISQVTGGTYTDVQDAAKLADSLGKVTATRAPRTATLTGQSVEGAPTQEQAPKVTPGTYTDTIQTGETLYYAFDVTAGQTVEARFTIDARNHQGNGRSLGLSLEKITGDQLAHEGLVFYNKKLERVSVKPNKPLEESGTIYVSVDEGQVLAPGETMGYTFQLIVTGAGPASPSDSAAGASTGASGEASAGAGAAVSPSGPAASGTAPAAPAATGFFDRQFGLPVVAGAGGGGLVAGLVAGSVLTALVGRRRRRARQPQWSPPPAAASAPGAPVPGAPAPGGPGYGGQPATRRSRAYDDRSTLPPYER